MIIMPFFCHVDLFSEFRRVVHSINNDIYFPQQSRLVTFYIEYAFLSVFQPFLKDSHLVFFLEDLAKSTSNLTDYFIFTNHPNVFRHLFIFKLPYLLFDILTMWVIWLFFDDKQRAKIAVMLWIFNPITLYASYFFGRYEAIPLFFIALTALLLKKEKFLTAAICLSLAINSREIYVVIAPVFIISLYNENLTWRKNLKTILTAGFILLVSVVIPPLLEHYLHLTPAFAQGSVYNDSRANGLYSMAYHWFYPLIFAYFLTLFVIAAQPFSRHDYKFLAGSGIVIASYFMITHHSAHYVAWLPLFPILLINYPKKARNISLAIVFLCLSWFVYRIFKGDINLFTLFLAAPFNFELTLFPSLPRTYSRLVSELGPLFSTDNVLNSLHTIYAGALVFLIYQMHKARPQKQLLQTKERE